MLIGILVTKILNLIFLENISIYGVVLKVCETVLENLVVITDFQIQVLAEQLG